MSRRLFLKLASGSLWVAYSSSKLLAGDNSRPNLLVIQTDEHNFRTLGCYRNHMAEEQVFVWGKDAKVDTPNIDWIADNGAICTKFYSTSPVCSPARSSFVSGMYPQTTKVVANDIPMSDDMVTYAKVLADAGYKTGYAGKWHLDGDGKPQWEPVRKFGFSDNRFMFNRGHWKQLEDRPKGPRVATVNPKGTPTYAIEGATEQNFTTDWLTTKAIEFINMNRFGSWCYHLSIPDSHGPNSVRKPYDTMFDEMNFSKPKTAYKADGDTPLWGIKQKNTISQDGMRKYFGMVKCIDDNIARLLACLRNNKILDNTIIVFTSDHGDLCGEHSRDNKGVPYEASAKVPFVIYYKNKIQAGTVVKSALQCVDFKATILALMGIDNNSPSQGRNASSLFLDPKSADKWEDIAVIRSHGDLKWVAAMDKRYKLVLSVEDKPWLFDLEKEPDETVNFFGQEGYQDVFKRLSGAIIDYGKKYKDPKVDKLTFA